MIAYQDLKSIFSSIQRAVVRYLKRQLTSTYDFRSLLVRFCVDIVLLNAAFFLGYIVAIIYNELYNYETLPRSWVRDLLCYSWLLDAPLYSAACIVALIVSGIYGGRPLSRMRQKIRICFRAVGLSYLFFICLHYLVGLSPRRPLPVSAFASAAVFSFVFITAARLLKKRLSDSFIIEPRHINREARKPEYVLLIGGAGYIGSTLARQLVRAQYNVRILDKLVFGNQAIADLHKYNNFELVQGDFRNIETLTRAIRGMDAVIHLGAIVGDPACALDEELTLSINTHAVRTIREICSGFGIPRLLFASTCSVYGAQDGIINEHSPLAPVSHYARSKIEAERVVLERKSTVCHSTVLRIATAFGLSQRMRFDLVVNLLAAKAATEKRITIINGHQWRPFIHVDDIARAFIACLDAPVQLISRKVYNVGDNDANYTLKELGDIFCRVVPGLEVVHETNSADPRSYRVDFSKIRNELGFRCLTTVEDGIRDMVEAVADGGFQSYNDFPYSNVQFMKATVDKMLANADFNFPRVVVNGSRK